MSVTATFSADKKTLEIGILGHFDFSIQKDFRSAYQEGGVAGLTYHVNLAGVEYMDSAALGMLMVLKKYADANSSQVILKAPRPTIKKILLTSKFDKLFKIEE